MSVLPIPAGVIKILIAPTLMVLTAVHVNKDSLEMARFVKISMSVLPIPVRVTRMPIAKIVKVLIAALVKKDSLEMALFAKT